MQTPVSEQGAMDRVCRAGACRFRQDFFFFGHALGFHLNALSSSVAHTVYKVSPLEKSMNPSQASRDLGKPLAFWEGLFASGGWGYPPDPLEMGREAYICGC